MTRDPGDPPIALAEAGAELQHAGVPVIAPHRHQVALTLNLPQPIKQFKIDRLDKDIQRIITLIALSGVSDTFKHSHHNIKTFEV